MQEKWDLYDRERKPLNKVAIRGTKLEDNTYHLVIKAWIKNSEGKYLISRRSPNKPHPYMWECTGGSVLMGENTLEGAIREVREELGIDVSKSKYAFIGSITEYDNLEGCIEDEFIFYKDEDIKNIKIQEEEVMDCKWATKEEILSLVKENKFMDIPFIEKALKEEV